tara:strand:- start:20792 stop:21454 length:663 start_codon:yes stop_codon:yes gene_type:complete
MKAIHDLGGTHGFGPIKMDSAIFHEQWEKDTFAISKIIQLHGICNVDEKRHAAERISPSRYLQLSYFEKWLDCIEMLLVEKGILTQSEINSRIELYSTNDISIENKSIPDLLEKVLQSFKKSNLKDVKSTKPNFKVGDNVLVNPNNKFGHSRSPSYAQKRIGTIEQIFGTFPLPDSIVEGSPRAEPVYKVRFSAQELWGTSYTESDSITLDLWESYLSPI